jgi:hypothetical protein
MAQLWLVTWEYIPICHWTSWKMGFHMILLYNLKYFFLACNWFALAVRWVWSNQWLICEPGCRAKNGGWTPYSCYLRLSIISWRYNGILGHLHITNHMASASEHVFSPPRYGPWPDVLSRFGGRAVLLRAWLFPGNFPPLIQQSLN